MGEKEVQDTLTQTSGYHRFRCGSCQRTFRYYANGVDRTRITQRIRRIAGMVWLLGISAREVAKHFSEVGIVIHYLTVWREGNALRAALIERFGSDYIERQSVDRDFLKLKTHWIGTSIVADFGEKSLVLGRMAEVDYRAVLDWLRPILDDLDIDVSLADGEAVS